MQLLLKHYALILLPQPSIIMYRRVSESLSARHILDKRKCGKG